MNQVYKRSGSHYPNLRRGEARRRKFNSRCAGQLPLGCGPTREAPRGSFMRMHEGSGPREIVSAGYNVSLALFDALALIFAPGRTRRGHGY